MGLLKKTARIFGAALVAATAGVAVRNALNVKTDEEIGHSQGFYEKYVKRPQDFFYACTATVAMSPVLAGTAILVKMKLGSPVLFTQDRPGKNEQIFKLYKFRSMSEERDKEGNLLSDDDRLTRFGKLLRSTSLDELPELINIIKGDMAFVGPRPLLVEYLPYYLDEEHRRHEVRPGLTGLAQINGRNAGTWEQRFDYDLQYVNGISFIEDIRIIIGTVSKVLNRTNILVGSEIPAGRLDDARKEGQ